MSSLGEPTLKINSFNKMHSLKLFLTSLVFQEEKMVKDLKCKKTLVTERAMDI